MPAIPFFSGLHTQFKNTWKSVITAAFRTGGFLRGKGEWMPLVFSFEGGMGILFFSTKRHSWSVHTPGYIPRWIWDEAAKEWNVIYRISAGKFQRIAIAPCGIYEPGWRKGLILRGHAVTLLHTLRYRRIRYQKHCNMSGCCCWGGPMVVVGR